MLTIPETLAVQSKSAAAKASGLKTPGRFLISGMLAGAYMGIGVVLMVSAAGPLMATGDGLGKLVSGLVFGVALTITVFAGADLATSGMMVFPVGSLMGSLSWGRATLALLFTFVANFVGALVFAAMIVWAKVLYSNAAAGSMLSDMLASKAGEAPLELFTRGILCNVLVCLAIWMASRITSDVAKIMLIFTAITAFVTSGFEHVVANMTTYWIGVLTGDANATAALFGKNMLWVGLGNLAGGAIFVGLAYWIIGGRPRAESVEYSGTRSDTPADDSLEELPAKVA